MGAQDQEYPGTAFTRSIGDSLAESLGVMAEPELDHHQIKANDKVLIVASDGIFEFIMTRGCLDMALLYNNPLEACLALVGESYKLWIERKIARTTSRSSWASSSRPGPSATPG